MQGTLYAVLKTKDDKLDKVSLLVFFSGPTGSPLCGGSNRESVHHLRNGASSGHRPLQQPQGRLREEERRLLHGRRALRGHPRRDPTCRGRPCSQDRGQVRPSAHRAHRCGHSRSPNCRYIMALAWINRLLCLFYEIQLSGKIYTAMGYPTNFISMLSNH